MESSQTTHVVNQEMVNYAMVKVAMQGALQEFELKMENHIQTIKTCFRREIQDFVTRDVSNFDSFL